MANGFGYEWKITDNTEEILQLTDEGIELLLEAIGLEAEGDVVIKISSPGWIPKEPIDTGRLKGSITHQVAMKDQAVHIGTNVKYAPYVEFGTGDQGTGTGKKWRYRDEEGKWHQTSGMKARPFLRTAMVDNLKKYKQIAADSLAAVFGD